MKNLNNFSVDVGEVGADLSFGASIKARAPRVNEVHKLVVLRLSSVRGVGALVWR